MTTTMPPPRRDADPTAIDRRADHVAGAPRATRRRPHRHPLARRRLLGGLAGVFLVNALVAVLQPGDFTHLVGRSAMGRMFPVDGRHLDGRR